MSIISLVFTYPDIACFSIFILSVFFYHLVDFLIQYYYHPDKISFESLLISKPYIFAMSCAVFEFFIEWYFFPALKSGKILLVLGTILCIFGDSMRKCAMIQAGIAFTHLIQDEKHPEHRLITSGIYKFFRHPGYLGWFIWSISTQILLRNPICCVLFFVMSVKFFQDRIEYEEETLIYFFGNEYLEYKKNTPTYIPFCNGYDVSNLKKQ